MIQFSRDEMLRLTAAWDGDRFDDGRPRVPDATLERLRNLTAEHAWHVLDENGYPYQYVGGWLSTQEHTLVGRAVTSQYLPIRPDYDHAVEQIGRERGFTEGSLQNTWVVDSLVDGDVMVADIFGKVIEGTVVGDNLGAAVAGRTKAGAVIDGGVRDLVGLRRLTSANFYYRAADPTPIRNVTLAGMNIPVRVGLTTVLPGDVVFGTESGVTFIPPHLAEEVARQGETISDRDQFAKQRIAEGRYTAGEIDLPVWADHIEEDYREWAKARAADGVAIREE